MYILCDFEPFHDKNIYIMCSRTLWLMGFQLATRADVKVKVIPSIRDKLLKHQAHWDVYVFHIGLHIN